MKSFFMLLVLSLSLKGLAMEPAIDSIQAQPKKNSVKLDLTTQLLMPNGSIIRVLYEPDCRAIEVREHEGRTWTRGGTYNIAESAEFAHVSNINMHRFAYVPNSTTLFAILLGKTHTEDDTALFMLYSLKDNIRRYTVIGSLSSMSSFKLSLIDNELLKLTFGTFGVKSFYKNTVFFQTDFVADRFILKTKQTDYSLQKLQEKKAKSKS